MNVPAYLARIGYAEPTAPSAETLRALHRAHMLAVPFENLDIFLGRRIRCDEAAFLHKIIGERRGGFCYELNGAFAALLRALGFPVTFLSARVASSDGRESPEFDHLALRLEVPSVRGISWLADVGFGDSFIEPLTLQPSVEQAQGDRLYRLVEIDDRFHVESAADGGWKRQYSFTLQPRELSEFAERCHYHQTSPESHFTRQRLCSRATPEGRITLSDMKLIENRVGTREERELAGEEQWRTALRDFFGVHLSAVMS